jgi:hypothetical protein
VRQQVVCHLSSTFVHQRSYSHAPLLRRAWASGTGYGHDRSSDAGQLWDPKAAEAAQRARDDEMQQVCVCVHMCLPGPVSTLYMCHTVPCRLRLSLPLMRLSSHLRPSLLFMSLSTYTHVWTFGVKQQVCIILSFSHTAIPCQMPKVAGGSGPVQPVTRLMTAYKSLPHLTSHATQQAAVKVLPQALDSCN